MNVLSLQGVTKFFGGLIAVNHVSFDVKKGEILSLIGPNGAGKTTVFNLITGNYQPSTGQIFFDNENITGLSPYKIVEKGIARTFQTIRLFKNMTVLENVLAGCHCRLKSGFFASILHLPAQQKEEAAAIERAMKELAFVGLDNAWNENAKELSYGNQRLLEIARALATNPKFLILDEPAGGMNDQETAELTNVIQLIRKQGITVLLIEHDMNLVMRVCNRLVVLEYGQVIAEGTPEMIKNNPLVIEAYLGANDE